MNTKQTPVRALPRGTRRTVVAWSVMIALSATVVASLTARALAQNAAAPAPAPVANSAPVPASTRASGSQVITLNAEQREAWRKAMQPVWQQFAGAIGADVMKAAQTVNRKSRE